MGNIKFGLVVAVFIGLIVWMSTYIVHERELVIKFKLGEIVESVTSPGLYWKIPVIHNIRRFDSRVLTLDTPSERFLTSEKKNVIVDSFVKWRISSPRDYYTSTQGDERIAVSRIVSILNDEMKGQFGSKTLNEVISGERSAIMQAVNENAGKKTRSLGVELVDVRIKKVELPENVSNSVFQRMIKERATVAKAFRSAGEEQAKGIRANADRQRTEVLAEAYRKSEEIRGDGDAQASKIYADAFGEDKEFYSFTRSLSAYRNSFKNSGDILVLNPESEFFKYFKGSNLK
ncbi:MAG: protease modulator HflC [Gammaproteobacteria bacterium]|nr:protease modulator HflC [Gammaproteobacteria bacterium]MBL7000475.1 protease modulator HflC [Gammaproteobacteria bacterium]